MTKGEKTSQDPNINLSSQDLNLNCCQLLAAKGGRIIIIFYKDVATGSFSLPHAP